MVQTTRPPRTLERPARIARLLRSTRGAVYVEFLIGFFPLLVGFLSLLQLAFVASARLVLEHAAITAARAAIVILPDDPATYGGEGVNSASGQRLEDVRAAARVPLLLFEKDPRPTVTFLSGGGGIGGSALVRVQVDYDYPCNVPIGGAIACALGGGRAHMGARAGLPNQGAGYAY